MKLLAPIEPEPQHDAEHLRQAAKLGLFPGWHLMNVALKRVEWKRRQRWWRRLIRRWESRS